MGLVSRGSRADLASYTRYHSRQCFFSPLACSSFAVLYLKHPAKAWPSTAQHIFTHNDNINTMEADNTTEFIAHLQEMPLLWKKEDKDFMNRDKRKKALEDLAEKTGMSADECKKKLKNLKDRMREICSKLPKTRSGQPAFEIGETAIRWVYYKPLLFMRDQFVSRPTAGKAECEDGETAGESIASISDEESLDALDSSTMLASTSTNPKRQTPSDDDHEPMARGKKAPKRRKLTRLDEQISGIKKEKIDNFKKATTGTGSPKMPDEWDSFASSICCDLRKLKDPLIIMRVKANINMCVNDAVLEQISLETPNSSYSEVHPTHSSTHQQSFQSPPTFPGSCPTSSAASHLSDEDDYKIQHQHILN